ncbi:hypothetical protein [Streptosporangium sandarakinum]|uniref:hypothetical protein n=1 Tax=Streptosporangium sandarakinum TaxID=1260955 RepID=UPI00371B8BFA
MGVTAPEPDASADPSDDQLLDPAFLTRVSYPFLRNKKMEIYRRREELRVDLVMKLAAAVSQAKRPLPEIAHMLGRSERALKSLIMLSGRERDTGLILPFFITCEVGDEQALRDLSAQLEAFKKLGMVYEAVTQERLRREAAVSETETTRLISERRVNPRETAIADAPGHDCKPNPLDARSQEEFVDTMRRYRIWAGNPSLREMARRCGQQFSHATFRNVLNAQTVPLRLDMVEAFVAALGGTAEDKIRWATAWRSFTVPQQETDNRKVTPLRLTGS